MKPRNAEAKRLESDYLERLESSLSGHEKFEINEIVQSVREHIEDALQDFKGTEITLAQMAEVLEQLGPPEEYAREEATPPPQAEMPLGPPTTSKLAIASVLVPFIGIILGVLLGILVGITISALGFPLGLVSLYMINTSNGRLKGKGLALTGMLFPFIALLLWLLLIMSWGVVPQDTHSNLESSSIQKNLQELPDSKIEEK